MMAKVGESGQPISKIREAVEVVRSANLNGTLRGGQSVFNIMGQLPSFLVPCINSALARRARLTLQCTSASVAYREAPYEGTEI
jgi:hypothetical protein